MHSTNYGNLLVRFTERDIFTRFAGSALGLFWALLGPLCLLAIYAFVFGQLLQQRFADLGTQSYPLFVAIAMWPWMMFADGLLRAMQSIQNNASLVKKVAFPHLLLILAALNGVFLIHLAGYAAVLLVLAAMGAAVAPTGIPLALLCILSIYLLALGAGALLAALQTLLRDVEQAVTPILTMLYFLTPVLYPITLIPEAYRGWLSWNPFAYLMLRLRDALLGGALPQSGDFLMLMLALTLAAGGALIFQRLSPYFEDFL